jgi:hypothetical protein
VDCPFQAPLTGMLDCIKLSPKWQIPTCFSTLSLY